MLTVAIMQPYFFPYIGYFQLMNAVDVFVVYDNVQYTKEGWINRNRILVNGRDEYISVPLHKASHCLSIRDRLLSDTWTKDRRHMLNRIRECYRRAPHFGEVYPLIEECVMHEERNLFGFILNSLHRVKDYLNIRTPLVISSTIDIDHGLKREYKVIEICRALGAVNYLNAIGGAGLYDRDQFEKEGITLRFMKTGDIHYTQFDNEFVPHLSIIDVMMFNDREKIREYLTEGFTVAEIQR